jgi:type II secretory pathway pseudopilin PulG
MKFSFSQTNKSVKGFTLLELIIAAGLTLVVSSVAMGGVVAIMRPEMKNHQEIDAGYESDRAQQLISYETKIAQSIEPGGVMPSGVNGTPVFSIKNGSFEAPIVYYITSSKPNSIWRGQKVLKRYGPNFSETGYETNWSHQIFLDGLSDQLINHTCTGDTPTPTDLTKVGVTGCINTSKTLMRYTLNRNMRQGSENFGQFKPNYIAVINNVKLLQQVVAIPPGATSATSGCTLSNNSIGCNGKTTFEITNLGGSIQCGKDAPSVMPVKLFMQFDQGDWEEVQGSKTFEADPKVTRVKAEAAGNYGCSGNTYSYDSTNEHQVKLLKDGDIVPEVKGFADQNSVEQFLRNYFEINEKGEKVVKLESNQVLVLMELGVTDQSSSAFDMQDSVVLITTNSDFTK